MGNTITNKLLDCYTFDLLIDNDEFYFIEPNSFGWTCAAGFYLFFIGKKITIN